LVFITILFPFKTKQFVVEITLCAEDLDVRLCNYSNSFRPVVVFNWKNVNDKAIITGHYRIQMGVIWLSYILPTIGIVQAFRYHTLAPVIFSCLLWVILQLFFYLLFMKDFDWFQSNFKDIVNGKFPQIEKY